MVMKNWLPLLSGPELAMDRIPGTVCFSLKFSSARRGAHTVEGRGAAVAARAGFRPRAQGSQRAGGGGCGSVPAGREVSERVRGRAPGNLSP